MTQQSFIKSDNNILTPTLFAVREFLHCKIKLAITSLSKYLMVLNRENLNQSRLYQQTKPTLLNATKAP